MKHVVKILFIIFLFFTSFCVSNAEISIDDVVKGPVISAEYSIEGENTYSILNSIPQDYELNLLSVNNSHTYSLSVDFSEVLSIKLFEKFCLNKLLSKKIYNLSSYIAWEFYPRAP